MMTCRLLCALLVLALCCCPYVRGKDANENEEGRSEKGSDQTTSTPGKPAQEMESHSATSPSPGTKEENKGTKPVENTALHTSQTTGKIKETPQSQNTSNNTQDQDGGNSNEQTEHTGTVTANEEKKATAPTTTTSTTQAPTTTTTTTTAPQAPSGKATTTEAPTTTTTRAPSRLRKIDGSLSSSAWVFAPLLLAVSALAYTTVG
ncbi:putative mucin TcMUCII [Trypanosoma cruzi]|nr:putative mucin TcMUCII [Trypanosoma cruzi]